jgi:arginyl-tRNA synthetase
MSPQEQDDMFIKNKMLQGETEAKKAGLKEFIKDWRRGIEAKQNQDPEQGDAYFRNAMARARVAGMSPEEINTAIALGNRGYERAIDNTDRNVWLKGDYNKRDARREIYKRQLDMKDKQ